MPQDQGKSAQTKSAQSIETKARILKASLKLFNERGSGDVTTHDIAEETGISPGNLYYHFKNKQAIVRSLFYDIEIFSIEKWWSKSPAHKEVSFTDFMRFYFGSLSKYRFFFREFSSLLNQDPLLAKEWKRTYQRLFSVMQETLAGWIKQGLIKPFPSAKEADVFIETVWILAAFSQVHLDARGGSGKSFSDDEALKILVRFLHPYHTAKGQRVIELYL